VPRDQRTLVEIFAGRRRRRSSDIGRTRIMAARILTVALGFQVSGGDIKPAEGSYRSCKFFDCYRWELFANNGTLPVVMGSWFTVTEFVRLARKHGVIIDYEDSEISPVETAAEAKQWDEGRQLEGPLGHLNRNLVYVSSTTIHRGLMLS